MWDFQLNDKVMQQLHEDHPSLDQVKILNVSYKDEKESLLNISLEEVLAADTVNATIISNKMDRVLRY